MRQVGVSICTVVLVKQYLSCCTSKTRQRWRRRGPTHAAGGCQYLYCCTSKTSTFVRANLDGLDIEVVRALVIRHKA
jgi:hypothetical protein